MARALRVADDQPGVTLADILPRVDPAARRLTSEELTPDALLLEEIQRYLDARKLPGTPVRLLPMRFRAVSVVVNLQVGPLAPTRPHRAPRDRAALHLSEPDDRRQSRRGRGRLATGRSLDQGELYAIMHALDAVEAVKSSASTR